MQIPGKVRRNFTITQLNKRKFLTSHWTETFCPIHCLPTEHLSRILQTSWFMIVKHKIHMIPQNLSQNQITLLLFYYQAFSQKYDFQGPFSRATGTPVLSSDNFSMSFKTRVGSLISFIYKSELFYVRQRYTSDVTVLTFVPLSCIPQ